MTGPDRHPAVLDRLRALAAGDPAYARLVAGLGASPAPGGPFPRAPRAEDPRVRACLITPSLNIGGADRWMIALMESTADRVCWTGVACTSADDVVPGIRDEAERHAPCAIGPAAVAEALAASDVAVVWGVDLARVDALADTDRPRARVVAVSHGVGPWTAGLLARAELAHTLAAVARASLRTFPEAHRSRAVVIENRVEPDRLVPRSGRDEVRRSWRIAPGEKALVQVGRLSPEKNPKAIADAVAALHRIGHREWRGVHVGAGWIGAEVRAHAQAVAPGMVRFPGTTDDVASAYLAADALALPSSEEACSLMQAEALWMGVPLIASAVGLTEEAEVADVCRTVRPGCSGGELARAVLADRADPEGTAARARRGRTLARERFDPVVFARRWADLIAAASGRAAAADVRSEVAEHAEARRCPHRGCQKGCHKARCTLHEVDVYLSDCVACRRAGRDRPSPLPDSV